MRRVLVGDDPLDRLFSSDYNYEMLMDEVIWYMDEFGKEIEVAIDTALIESDGTYGLDGYVWLATLGKDRADFKRDIVQRAIKKMDGEL
jgi:hypothetical protein